MMQKRYTAELSKGQGIIEETVALLRAWEPGMDTMALKEQVKREGIIDRATALRVEDIVGRLFAPRFLVSDGSPAKNLKLLLLTGVPVSKLQQLFFLHAARAHSFLRDFITQVYWPKYAAAVYTITRQDALDFVERAKDTGLITPPWSASTTVRMARYVGSALADFGLTGSDHAGRREILPFRLSTLAGRYLAYELHFRNIDDNSLQHAEDWQLFGLEPMDVRHELERISGNHFIVQHTGDLLRISWTHPSMEEALHAIAADELR
jgi:hypothetical protein